MTTREEKIAFLLNRDVESISNEVIEDTIPEQTGEEGAQPFSFTIAILRDGFKGYNNFTDEELDEEVKEAQALD